MFLARERLQNEKVFARRAILCYKIVQDGYMKRMFVEFAGVTRVLRAHGVSDDALLAMQHRFSKTRK